MKLTVNNLGAIKSGEVNFVNKNLIVFTGPNNTGKSYLTYLIHAIHNLDSLLENKRGVFPFIQGLLSKKAPMTKMVKSGKVELRSIITSYNEDISTLMTRILEANFVKIFASTNINPSVKISIQEFDLDNITVPTIIGYKVEDNKAFTMWADGTINKKASDTEATVDKMLIRAQVMLDMFMEDNGPFGKSYIFPSERTAINLFARDIVAKKAVSRDDVAFKMLAGGDVEEIARSLTQEQNLNPKYPFAVNDYISFVHSFEGSPIVSELEYLAIALEETIMGGAIKLNPYNQPQFQPQGTTHALSLHESSSLVKSLSFFVIYLRYFAKKGDWVIIDEPEMNLHPDLQVAIARIFAKMINAGLRVILSTHSDYLIKELNTLVLLHDLYEHPRHRDFIKKQGYAQDEFLGKDQVGAYYLDKGTVNLIDVATTGIVVPTIDKTIDKIDNLAEEIYFKLSEPEPVKPVRKKKA
jgi:predicted ATPase